MPVGAGDSPVIRKATSMSKSKNPAPKKWTTNQVIFGIISFIILLSMVLSLFSN